MKFAVYLFFAVFGVYCSELNNNQISKSLSGNLQKLHENAPVVPFNFNIADNSDYKMLKFFFDVAFDVALLCLEYLDKESVSLFLNQFEILNNFVVQTRLLRFSPYFLFEVADQNMNQIMHNFLSENFFSCGIKSLTDSRMKDALSILHYDSILKNTNRYDIIYMLRCFMQEMVYGTSEPMINLFKQWRYFFIRNLFDSQSQMPRCIENYLDIASNRLSILDENYDIEFNEQIFSNIELNNNIKRIINFFATNPNDSDLLEFYRNYIENDENIAKFNLELKLAVIFKLKLFEDFDMQEFEKYFNYDLSHSPALKKDYKAVPRDHDFVLVDPYISIFKEEIQSMKCVYKNEMYRNQLLKYLWSRDLQNPFDMNEFFTLNNGDISNSVQIAILEICSCVNLSLIHFDILRQLIRLNIYDFGILRTIEESPIYKIFWNDNAALLELILEEVSCPVNFFILNSGKYQLINNAACVSTKMHVAFMKNINIDEPLSLFVIAGFLFYVNIKYNIYDIDELENYLEMLKKRISKTNFDIDNLFIFDIDGNDFQSENKFDDFYSRMQGKCLSFKQIIYHLSLSKNITEYIDMSGKRISGRIFDIDHSINLYPMTSNILINVFDLDFYFTIEDINETEVEIKSKSLERPVYSLAKLIKLGVLET